MTRIVKKYRLHDLVLTRYINKLKQYANDIDITFQSSSGKVDVTVIAIFSVVWYGTLFHFNHDNRIDFRQIPLAMWYYLGCLRLPG